MISVEDIRALGFTKYPFHGSCQQMHIRKEFRLLFLPVKNSDDAPVKLDINKWTVQEGDYPFTYKQFNNIEEIKTHFKL